MSDASSVVPDEIPDAIRALARPLREALSSLARSRVSIVRGEVYRGEAELIPLDDWECHRVGTEQPTSFAERSRAVAEGYVRKYSDDVTGPVLFVFDFDTQNAAA